MVVVPRQVFTPYSWLLILSALVVLCIGGSLSGWLSLNNQCVQTDTFLLMTGHSVMYKITSVLNLSLCVRKPTIWVLTRSDTNQAVQSQKMARGLKFCI